MKIQRRIVGWFVIFCCVSLLSSTLVNAEVRYGVTIGGNRDYPKGNYYQFVTDNLDDCVQYCGKDARCYAFSYVESSGECSVKGYIDEAVRRRGVIAGYKLTARDISYHEGGTFSAKMSEMPGVDLPGSDYSNFSAKKAAHCSSQCLKDQRCKSFTFNRNTRVCWLKSSEPGRRESKFHVSGVKLTDSSHTFNEPILPKISMTNLRKIDLPGGDYRHFEARKASRCSEECLDESRCKAFTFNRKTRTCWLKSSRPSERYHESYVSGIKVRENVETSVIPEK